MVHRMRLQRTRWNRDLSSPALSLSGLLSCTTNVLQEIIKGAASHHAMLDPMMHEDARAGTHRQNRDRKGADRADQLPVRCPLAYARGSECVPQIFGAAEKELIRRIFSFVLPQMAKESSCLTLGKMSAQDKD